MYAGDGGIRALQNSSRTVPKSFQRRCDESGKKPCYTGRSERQDRAPDLVLGAAGRVEIHSGKAVDLQIEEAWKLDSHFISAITRKLSFAKLGNSTLIASTPTLLNREAWEFDLH